MQYSLLTEVWGQHFHENINSTQPIKKISAGNSTQRAAEQNSLEAESRNTTNNIQNGEQDFLNSQDNEVNKANAENPVNPKKEKLINPNDIGYCKGGGSIIKNDNYILLGLLLLFIVDTFYNL